MMTGDTILKGCHLVLTCVTVCDHDRSLDLLESGHGITITWLDFEAACVCLIVTVIYA